MQSSIRKVLLSSCLFGLASHSGLAGAQSRMTVPFSFLAGKTSCSPGAYFVVRDPTIGSLVHLMGTTSTCGISGTLGEGDRDSTYTNVVALRFRQVGAQRVLESMQLGGKTAVVSRPGKL